MWARTFFTQADYKISFSAGVDVSDQCWKKQNRKNRGCFLQKATAKANFPKKVFCA
jgi:hypothetical protein